MNPSCWAALAEAVRRRRNWLGLRQADLEREGGPSGGTVRNIEQAARTKYASRTFTQLDKALRWPAGTTERIARGAVAAQELESLTTADGPRRGYEWRLFDPDGNEVRRCSADHSGWPQW